MIGVNPRRPQTAEELLNATKVPARPDHRRDGRRHLGGHAAMDQIVKATGVKYRHVTYDGGNPAVVAVVAGEADLTTQLAVEQADMIRGKRLRQLPGHGQRQAAGARGLRHHPAAVADHSRLQRAGQLLRHLHPQGRAGRRRSRPSSASGPSTSPRARRSRSTRPAGARCSRLSFGDAAQKAVFPAVQANAWLLFQRRQGQGLARHGRHRGSPERERSWRARPKPATPLPSTRREPQVGPAPPPSCTTRSAGSLLGGLVVFGSVTHGSARAAGHQQVHRARPRPWPARHRDAAARRCARRCAAGGAVPRSTPPPRPRPIRRRRGEAARDRRSR